MQRRARHHKHHVWQRRALVGLCIVLGLSALIPPQPASAIAEGDGWLTYNVNLVTQAPSKQYTAGTGWGSEIDMGGAKIQRFTKLFSSPVESDMRAFNSANDGTYFMFHWNGASWDTEWTDAGGGSSTAYTPRFDMAYANNGDAIAVYSDNTTGTNEMWIRRYTHSAGTWGSPVAINALRTSGTVRNVRVENRPGTDEFAIVWYDATYDLSATYYDFSSDSFSGEPAAAISTNLGVLGVLTEPRTRLMDVAIESSSGETLICFSEEAVTDLKCITRSAGTGGSWGSVSAYTTVGIEPEDIELSANPDSSSNTIAFAGNDGSSLEAAIWDGTNWGNHAIVDSTIDTLESVTVNCALAWVKSGATSQVVLTYDDLNVGGTDWATYNPATTTWAVQSDITTAFSAGGGNDKFHDLTTNPLDQDEIVSIVVDTNNDVSVKMGVFNGSTYAWSSLDDGTASHNASSPTHGGWVAAFGFYAFAGTPVLTADIVDSGGTSVASPSVTMGAITSGNTCQTATGTLGTSSQKIRITNTTTTPGWTLSVAATGGATANWSATTYTYDYNDASSSGCADGADTDSIAGQLTVDASASTNTPQSGCTTTGVTLGSSSAFSEGSVGSVTLLSASGSAGTNCYWDLTDVSLSQKVPSYQEPGAYTLPLTLTVTAN